jgi:hypothetical protein
MKCAAAGERHLKNCKTSKTIQHPFNFHLSELSDFYDHWAVLRYLLGWTAAPSAPWEVGK